jgi:hypothetical protein
MRENVFVKKHFASFNREFLIGIYLVGEISTREGKWMVVVFNKLKTRFFYNCEKMISPLVDSTVGTIDFPFKEISLVWSI